MKYQYKLNNTELYMCALVGVYRRLATWKSGKFKDLTGSPWEVDIEAACAELCVAKFLNKCWDVSGFANRKKGDVGSVEVRHAKRDRENPDAGRCLIIYEKEDDLTRPFVLVIGSAGDYELVGWIFGEQSLQMVPQKENPEGGKGPERWVHQKRLRDMDKFPSSYKIAA